MIHISVHLFPNSVGTSFFKDRLEEFATQNKGSITYEHVDYFEVSFDEEKSDDNKDWELLDMVEEKFGHEAMIEIMQAHDPQITAA